MRDYNIDVISNVKNQELNEFYDNVFKDRNNFLKHLKYLNQRYD